MFPNRQVAERWAERAGWRKQGAGWHRPSFRILLRDEQGRPFEFYTSPFTFTIWSHPDGFVFFA